MRVPRIVTMCGVLSLVGSTVAAAQDSKQAPVEILLRLDARHVRIDFHDGGKDLEARFGRVALVLDGVALPRQGDTRSVHTGDGWYGVEVLVGQGLANGPHSLIVSGLDAAAGMPVAVTAVAVGGVRVDSLSPWTSETTSDDLSDGERLRVYFAPFTGQTLDLRLESTRSASGSLAWLQRAAPSAVPLLTALVILTCTTWIQRWFLIRNAQLEATKALHVRLARIKQNNDLSTRKDFVDLIADLQLKGPYAGFGERFTTALEAILARGNVDDVPFYEAKLKEVKPDVRLAWVLFIPGSR